MKYIITWTLVLLISLHYVGISILYGVYEFDRQLFIELFCENTDKPEMHCNGACMLSKMSDQEPQEASKTVHFDALQFQMYLYNELEQNSDKAESEETERFFFYSNLYSSLYCFDILHPPVLI